MKKFQIFLAIVLILAMFTSIYAYSIDGICERDKGESCMNSKDCSLCLIKLYLNLEDYSGAERLNILVKSEEPSELDLKIVVEEENTEIFTKRFNLEPKESKNFYIDIEKWLRGKDVYVKILDAKTNKLYAYDTIFIKKQSISSKTNILIWLIYVLIALIISIGLGILFFSLNKKTKVDRYNVPVYQVGETTSVPSQYMYIPVVVSPSTVLVKKKKYYYTKKE